MAQRYESQNGQIFLITETYLKDIDTNEEVVVSRSSTQINPEQERLKLVAILERLDDEKDSWQSLLDDLNIISPE